MIEIERDPVDVWQLPTVSFPQSLDARVASFRYYRVRDGEHVWVARVQTGHSGWREGIFDVDLPGLVVVCGDGQAYLVSTDNPEVSVELPVYPIVGITRGSTDLRCLLYSFTDLAAVRRDGTWWIVRDLSADGIRIRQVKGEVIYLEVWSPERSAWERRRLSVLTGDPPAREARGIA